MQFPPDKKSSTAYNYANKLSILTLLNMLNSTCLQNETYSHCQSECIRVCNDVCLSGTQRSNSVPFSHYNLFLFTSEYDSNMIVRLINYLLFHDRSSSSSLIVSTNLPSFRFVAMFVSLFVYMVPERLLGESSL